MSDATPCPHCFGVHEPDTPETWVGWPTADDRMHPPYLCLCCGKETCARQFAYGRTCGLCDTGICQTNPEFAHPPYNPAPRPEPKPESWLSAQGIAPLFDYDDMFDFCDGTE